MEIPRIRVTFASVLFACLALTGQAHRPVDIELLHPARLVPVPGSLAESDAEWADVLFAIPDMPDNMARAVIFPREAIRPVTIGSVTSPCELLMITKEHVIVGLNRGIRSGRVYCSPASIVACVLLPDGFCDRNGIVSGNLINIRSESLSPKSSSRRSSDEEVSARDLLNRNLERFPDDDDLREHIGLFEAGVNNLPAAQAIFESLIQKSPTADRWYWLAAVLAGRNQMEASIASARKALELDPGHMKAFQLLIRIVNSGSDSEATLRYLTEHATRQADSPELRIELARFHLNSGDPVTARTLLDGIPELDDIDRQARIHRLRGDIHLRLGEYNLAAREIAAYLRLYPYDTHVSDLRIFIARHAGSPDTDSR